MMAMLYMVLRWSYWGAVDGLWFLILASINECSYIAASFAALLVCFPTDLSSSSLTFSVASSSSPVTSSRNRSNNWALQISSSIFAVLVSTKPLIAATLLAAFLWNPSANSQFSRTAGIVTCAIWCSNPGVLEN